MRVYAVPEGVRMTKHTLPYVGLNLTTDPPLNLGIQLLLWPWRSKLLKNIMLHQELSE